MTALRESLVGVWSGSAFPTQKTTVVFCPGGQGLFFFYAGSGAETPFVDEFTWSVGADERLSVRWLSRHEFDYGPDEGDGDEEEDDDDEPALIVTYGAEETSAPELAASGPIALRLTLGRPGPAYVDTWLAYLRAPDSYEAERDRLRTAAETFTPFDPARRVWRVEGDRWSAVRPFFAGRGWLGLNETRLLLAFMLFGATGQTLLWGRLILTHTVHQGWILLPLLFLPLFAVFRETYFPGRRWYQFCLGLQVLLSALYLPMAAAGLALALSAGPVRQLVVDCTVVGLVPALYLLWANPQKWRLDVRTTPALSVTLREWRGWRTHDMNVWLLWGIMAGILGEMFFLLHRGPPWLTKWPRILLHCVPALIAVCDDGQLTSRAAQKFGALWYVAVLGLVAVAFGHGWRPAGWSFLFAAMLLGLGPCAYAWRKPERGMSEED